MVIGGIYNSLASILSIVIISAFGSSGEQANQSSRGPSDFKF